jgi:hypothetical protein
MRALGDAAGLAVEPAKAPALAAQPADILVGSPQPANSQSRIAVSFVPSSR